MRTNTRRWLQTIALWGVLVVLLFALKLPNTEPAGSHDANRPLRVALFVNGTLGDKSFFDSAARGLKQAASQPGVKARVIEAGVDPSHWESTFVDVVEGQDFDVIATGGFAMVAVVQRIAPQYPATRFVVFDAAVDYAKCKCGNVYSMLFRQNEGAYLAGYLASLSIDSAGSQAAKRLGAIGAMQIPVIDDFLIGFEAGAKAAQPDVQVLRQYVNSFTDPAAAKEIAKAMYGQGVALIFHAAAGSGQGVIEASAEAKRAAIGVDSDQYALFKTSNPERARYILTSVLKNVDAALLRAVQRHQAGQLPYGHTESLGLLEGGVSLSTGSELMERLPQAVLTGLADTQRRVIAGAVKVPSAFAAASQK